jgi:signal transduction histidine kinase
LRKRPPEEKTSDESGVSLSPTATALISSDLTILEANRAFTDLVGQMPRLLDAIHPDERVLVKARLDDLASAKAGSLRLNVRLVRNKIPALLIARSAKSGKRGMVAVSLIDLSDVMVTADDRIQLLDAIERVAWEWRRTFDAVEMPIVILAADLIVGRINRAARMLAGKEYNEIIGQPITRFADAEPWMSIADLSREVQKARAPSARQVRDAAGRTLDLLAMLFNADDPADPRVIVIVWDVTTLVDLQTRYEQQRTMATIGTLVAGVAHEVRNPLFAFSATLDAMEQSPAGTDLSEYFDVLRGEIDRMSALMRDLLAYGRPSAPSFAEVPLRAVVEEALRGSTALAQKHGVRVDNRVTEELGVVVDRERLARALQNLVANAIQHSPASSVVTIDCAVRSRGKSRSLALRVTDQGAGFRPDDIARVFEPFYSRRKGGTGLGLALVQQIVIDHGGEVVAANATGGGAEVTMTLPLPR